MPALELLAAAAAEDGEPEEYPWLLDITLSVPARGPQSHGMYR